MDEARRVSECASQSIEPTLREPLFAKRSARSTERQNSHASARVERSFAWAARFRRLARDYERLAPTFAGFHWLAFLGLMLNSLFRESA